LFSRVSPAERRRIVAEFRRSGLTQARFAASVGVSAQALSRWVSKLGDKETEGALASQRVAVQVFDPAAPSRAVFELAFGSKLSLRVPVGFDEGELRRLVAILRESC
jgi:transposase-like protein